MLPPTYQAFRRSPGETAKTIVQVTEPLPSLQPQDVLIKVYAVSLNYRDVGMLHGKYPVSVKDQGIPASDCAGKVVALGSGVSRVALEERVSPIFDLMYLEKPDLLGQVAQLGGNVDGVLRQYAVFHEDVLVRVPKHLSWEEVCLFQTQSIIPYFNLTLCRQHALPVPEPLHGIPC